MLMTIALVVILVIAAVLVFAATRPSQLRVERTITIDASPEAVFPLINDFHNWSAWSPYERRDPTMKKAYSGSYSGKGAVYAWKGNGQVGEGRMEIADTLPPSRVTIALHFVKPFEGHNVATFTLAPRDRATDVTWAMEGPLAYPVKVLGLFLSMDNMVGKDFEAGLVNLKGIVEAH